MKVYLISFMYKVIGQSTAYLSNILCTVEMLPLYGWVGELEGATICECRSSFLLLCEKPNTVAVSGKALLSQYPYCCIPNALCAVSLITECGGCNSCYSFIQTFLCCQVIGAHYPQLLYASPAIISKWPFHNLNVSFYERWLAAGSWKLYLPREGCTLEQFKLYI